MKELSIEQKARAYDKAFERAKRMFSEKELNYIFSELTESEDEKIKKRIIQAIKIREKEMNEEWSDEIAWIEKQGSNLVKNGYTNNKDVIEYAGNYSRTIWRKLMDNFKNIKDYHIGCNDVSDIVLNAIIDTYNWLEKQGEKEFTFKSIPRLLEMIEPTDRAKSYCQKLIDSLIKEGYVIDAMIVGECLKQMNGEDVSMAVMDKQKPADKTESKFKVGNWIISKTSNLVYHVDSILCKRYYLSHNGGIVIVNFADEQNYRLWTIQDAKDGDVLADNYGIYIFDRFDEYDERCFLCMGAYQYSQKMFKNEHMLCSVEVYPATKEQRNLLFQKMHEAGYTFDFKKKEVKKLKFKVGDEIITENEESLTITRIDEEGYWSNDLFICGFDDSDEWELVEQRPEWGEEDEKRLDRICKTLWKNRKGDTDEIYQQEQDINWLKSLKPQPKQQWSEEDKERYISCLQRLGTGNPDQPETINSKWFKEHVTSLPQWKPNKKQMHFSNWLANVKLGDSVVEQEVSKNLNELYNDLTKL